MKIFFNKKKLGQVFQNILIPEPDDFQKTKRTAQNGSTQQQLK
jgi:hypothetical protein